MILTPSLLPSTSLLLSSSLQPHYKESQLYLTRFKQYLSRALALVKQHVVNTLRNTTASVLPKPVQALSLSLSTISRTHVHTHVHCVFMPVGDSGCTLREQLCSVLWQVS